MTEEQLRQAMSSGFANPEHLDQLLERTDLPRKRLHDLRTNLVIAAPKLTLANHPLKYQMKSYRDL